MLNETTPECNWSERRVVNECDFKSVWSDEVIFPASLRLSINIGLALNTKQRRGFRQLRRNIVRCRIARNQVMYYAKFNYPQKKLTNRSPLCNFLQTPTNYQRLRARVGKFCFIGVKCSFYYCPMSSHSSDLVPGIKPGFFTRRSSRRGNRQLKTKGRPSSS